MPRIPSDKRGQKPGQRPRTAGGHPRLTRWLVAVILVAPCISVNAQSAPDSSGQSRIHWRRLSLLGGVGGALHYAGFRYFDHAWYEGQKTDHIRWINDWSGETYLNLDKGAHFMAGMTMAQTIAEALRWTGFRTGTAAFAGTAASWAFLFEIEMRDAYFDQWGFSIPDFTANTLGACVPLIHTFLPRTQAVRFKFSYHPSSLYLDRQTRALVDRPRTEHLIDDYEGMTFWMAVSPEDLLPATAAARWPDYLGLALGYGAHGLHGSNVKSKGPNKRYPDLPDAQGELFLALDWDPRRLPTQSRLGSWLKTRLDWIHLPAPAVRLRPEWGIYLLYM